RIAINIRGTSGSGKSTRAGGRCERGPRCGEPLPLWRPGPWSMPRASAQPLGGVYVSRENQDRRCSLRSEILVDRAAEALCKRFYDLESVTGTGIGFARAVVRDSA